MLNEQNFLYRPVTTLFVCYSLVYIILIAGSFKTANSYPTEGLNMFSSQKTKNEDKISSSGDPAELSFQELIHSKPNSIIIGEIKPNSSDQELLLLKDKIASTILSMQETEASRHQEPATVGGDCVIEVTRVERVAGKWPQSSE